MSSFVRNLILDKIYDEITKEDEIKNIKKTEKIKIGKKQIQLKIFLKD